MKLAQTESTYDVIKAEQLRVYFQALSSDEKEKFLSSLSKSELREMYKYPRIFLFDKQVIPDGDWTYCILRCGRRFGKSVTGATWIAEKIYQGAKQLGICGATYGDVFDVMVPNIIKCFPDGEAKYNSQHHCITYKDAVVHCYTSDTEVRGPSLEYTWCDEVCKWADGIPDKIDLRFRSLKTATSKGIKPQMVVTSTPKPFPLFFKWEEEVRNNNKAYVIKTGTMFDNPYLSKEYIDSEIANYGNTPLGRQEIYGDLIEDVAGALWNPKLIEDSSITREYFEKLCNGEIDGKPLVFNRLILTVDPAVSNNANSDETGIILAGLANNKVYVLGDYSGRYNPEQWADLVNTLYKEYDCDTVVAEKNQGGLLVETNLKTKNKHLNVKLIHASQKKIERAEVPAAMYHRKKVFHVHDANNKDNPGGDFSKLEWQMTHYTGDKSGVSPDRLDALCYAVNELLAQKVSPTRHLTNIPFRG